MLTKCNKTETTLEESREKGGILRFNAGPNFQNKAINVHYFIPKGNVKDMGFQVIMHGADRNAKDYIVGWTEKARAYNLILIAPEFNSVEFNAAAYNEGNLLDAQGNLNSPELTTFSMIDQMFEFFREEFKLKNTRYNIYGHSAGAQFVHRFMQFYTSPYVDKAAAANAGWYTILDDNVTYPYGIRGLVADGEIIRSNFYRKPLFILLGTADTLRNNMLRTTAGAENQGRHRLQRGIYYYETNKRLATERNLTFNMQRIYVENIGHEHVPMSSVAADLLYK